MSASNIETKNLRLVPHAPEHVRALIQGEEFYARSFGWAPANGLREFYVSKDVSPDWLKQLEIPRAADPWKDGFGVVHKASGSVIGAAGFKGAPSDEGMVEIAYGIVPDYQGKGFATEAAEALVGFALACGKVRLARAHTLPEANASTRVLTKCGFIKIGEVTDPEDGLIWRWEKRLQSEEQFGCGV